MDAKTDYFCGMKSFNDTKVAFQYKSDADLRKAYWLFRIIASPLAVRIGKPLTNIAFKLRLPIKGIIRQTIFHQFCGGEDIEGCDPTIKDLAKANVGTILDYSVEGKTEEEDFEKTVEEIIDTIEAGRNNPEIPFAVFKLTGICRFRLLERANNPETKLTAEEQAEANTLEERVNRICKKASEANTSVFIDAEESWIQDGIDRLTYLMMEKYNKERAVVYNTVQMYRHDRLAHLKKQINIAKEKGYKLGVKLVRGAYMEKERDRAEDKGYPSPIQANKAATDKDFNEGLRVMLDNIEHCALCAGSHNEDSNLLLTELMDEKGIKHDDGRVYFAQLLGMSDHISFNLAHRNFRVAKYVPYGPIEEVLPYLMRRADENTSVAGQTGRELSLITTEINRRKQEKKHG